MYATSPIHSEITGVCNTFTLRALQSAQPLRDFLWTLRGGPSVLRSCSLSVSGMLKRAVGCGNVMKRVPKKSNVSENERVRSVLRGAQDLTANENERKRLWKRMNPGALTLRGVRAISYSTLQISGSNSEISLTVGPRKRDTREGRYREVRIRVFAQPYNALRLPPCASQTTDNLTSS
jgi:hypothetical protein